ncbi:hypothetical protein D3C86_1604330 [compost metagenome]
MIEDRAGARHDDGQSQDLQSGGHHIAERSLGQEGGAAPDAEGQENEAAEGDDLELQQGDDDLQGQDGEGQHDADHGDAEDQGVGQVSDDVQRIVDGRRGVAEGFHDGPALSQNGAGVEEFGPRQVTAARREAQFDETGVDGLRQGLPVIDQPGEGADQQDLAEARRQDFALRRQGPLDAGQGDDQDDQHPEDVVDRPFEGGEPGRDRV